MPYSVVVLLSTLLCLQIPFLFMGVAGLWDILKPASKTRSLTELAVTEGFNANPRGLRGYRVGIDASIWFFHAEYGKEGENPVLRTLFFRCAALLKVPFLPLFVFDGPKRPEFKRGKRINKTGNKLIPGMKRLIDAFGFEWRTAPGEAEAELAYLNRIGVIDGILSDDVDTFLFGGLTVIRNPSNNLSGNKLNPILNSEGKDDKNHTRVFRFQDIHEHSDIQLTRGGLVLIGLMSGGDYEGGLERCGVTTAHAIAHCGFGDALFDAACNLSRERLIAFVDGWRQDVRDELRTNSRGFMTRKAISLAKSIPDTFPNIDVLLSYVNPVTSESLGHEGSNPKITWSKELDIAALASACELFFEWGYKEAIVKRFRTVIWPGAILRSLRRAVLDMDRYPTPSAEHKSKRTHPNSNEGLGTPLEIITQRISVIDLNDNGNKTDTKRTEEDLIVSISRERTHASTDGLPEYRLEVAPARLVDFALSGLQGLRRPEGPNEWASDEDETDQEDEEGIRSRKGKAKEPMDPRSHVRLWMPACMVEPVEEGLVSDFRDIQKRRKQRRAPAKKQRPESSQSKSSIHEKKAPTTSEKVSDSCNGQFNIFTSNTRSGVTPAPESCDIIEEPLLKTPSKPIPQLSLHKHKARSKKEDEDGLTIIPILAPTDKVKSLVTAPTKKSSTRLTTLSKAAQVATIFSESTTTVVPSTQTIEATLTLTDSDDELPTNIYSILPNRPPKPVVSPTIPGYLSLSDNDHSFVVPASPKQMNKKRTMFSTYLGQGSKMLADGQNGKLRIPLSTKSPRKSKLRTSPSRDKGNTDKGAKGSSPVVEISDESDSDYRGISRPVPCNVIDLT